MTLRTLRKHLKDFPPDTEVWVYAGSEGSDGMYTTALKILKQEWGDKEVIFIEPDPEWS